MEFLLGRPKSILLKSPRSTVHSDPGRRGTRVSNFCGNEKIENAQRTEVRFRRREIPTVTEKRVVYWF